jgi:hypothetical protein
MYRNVFRPLVLALALPLLGASLASGCAKQSEGQPCDFKGGSDDCESGLVCTDSKTLRSGSGVAQDRCCPQLGQPIHDARCFALGIGTGGTAGTGPGGAGGSGAEDAGDDADGDAASGAGGSGGTGGSDAGDGAETCPQPCSINSDCGDTEVCSQEGCCQPECREDRDCETSEACVAGTCQAREPEPEAGPD